MSSSLQQMFTNIQEFFTQEIWRTDIIEAQTLKAKIYRAVRILYLFVRGVDENRLFSEAASLAYGTLISLGPLLAIVIMASSFLFADEQVEYVIFNSISKAIEFVAPSASEFYKVGDTASAHSINPQIVSVIQTIVDSAKSGTAGAVGILLFIAILIQQVISLEDSFNTIWGVKQGRPWSYRIVFYWAFLSFGIIILIFSLALFSTVSIVAFVKKLPFGLDVLKASIWLAPLFSYTLLSTALAVFYRFMPNTEVKWGPAFVGGSITALLLFINNYLSFMYVGKALQSQSLYGSVGIVPVLMFGLYIFWLFIVMGTVITYSLQNALFLSYQRVWSNTSFYAREILSFAALVLIARRFKACKHPLSVNELSSRLKVPSHLLNTCLTWLADEGLVSLVGRPDHIELSLSCYEPARPLESISLSTFKQAFENVGNSSGIEIIQELDPAVTYYAAHWKKAYQWGTEQSLDQLLQVTKPQIERS